MHKKRELIAYITAVAVALLVSTLVSSISMAGEVIHVPIPGGLQGKTCFECHIAGEAESLPTQRTVKYSLTQAFETYLQSPHGRLRRLGDYRAPMCEGCHGTREWKDILPQEHPDSPVNPANLANTCATCHGKSMLRAKVTEGSMHLALAERSLMPGEPIQVTYGMIPGMTKREKAYYIGPIDITAYINWFFTVLTVGTLTMLVAYVVLDMRRKLIERGRKKRGDKNET